MALRQGRSQPLDGSGVRSYSRSLQEAHMDRHGTVRLTRREALNAAGVVAAGALLDRLFPPSLARATTRAYDQQPAAPQVAGRRPESWREPRTEGKDGRAALRRLLRRPR